MRIFHGCLLALLLAMVPVFAQDQVPGDDRQPPSAEQIISMMQTKLNLTQDQVMAITPIIEKYSTKREELRQSIEDGTADRDSLRVQMKQLRLDEAGELSQVLSAQQMAQFKRLMDQRRHKSISEGSVGQDKAAGASNVKGGNNGG